MSKTIELLLTENVESLGIVGDVVKVRTGYARNFLLPRELATTPSEERILELAAKRASAEREIAHVRAQREKMIEAIEGLEITIERSCNDQGLLYGSVTQQDIVASMLEKGFHIRPRDVRIAQTIKRIDSYEVLIKPEADLEATIKLWVVSDRPLDLHRRDHAPQEPAHAAAQPAAEPVAKAGEPKADAPPESRPEARKGGRVGKKA